jgi:hypothetical protein
VLDAKRLCDQGDCETAHQRVSKLADASPARGTQEFRDVEFKWAAMTLLRADGEQDMQTKRSLLERVAESATVDPQVRSTASDRLSLLQPGPVMAQPKDAGKATAPPPQPPVHQPPDAPQTAAPTTAPPRPPPAAKQTAFDLAKSDNPADWQKARDMLEPRVFAKRGTADEVRLLKALCKRQSDRTCTETLKNLEPAP